MCDVFADPGFSQPPLSIPTASLPLPIPHLLHSVLKQDIEKLWQHAIMFLGAIVLGILPR
jgi:hypothetical protein